MKKNDKNKTLYAKYAKIICKKMQNNMQKNAKKNSKNMQLI